MRNTLAYHISFLYRDFLRYSGDALKELGLHFGQLPFLIYIGKYPDCTQADLTRGLKLDWGYSQRGLAKLAEGGFITKHYDEEISANRLTLTKSGQQAFAVSHSVFDTWDQEKAEKFTPEEKELPIFVPLLEAAGVTSFHITLANHARLEDTIPPENHPVFGGEGCFLQFCDTVRQ